MTEVIFSLVYSAAAAAAVININCCSNVQFTNFLYVVVV
jgi:hypothetical protein